jgi:hypothetical protein
MRQVAVPTNCLRRQSSGSDLQGKPRNRADADIESFRNLARRLALGDALPRFLGLVGREDRLAPHLDAFGARDLAAFVCALDDAQAFVLGHGGHHRHKATPHGGGEVDIAAVENLDGRARVDHVLNDLQAVPHRARGAIPFRDHQRVAAVKLVEHGDQLRASGHALARRRIGTDRVATGALQRLDLTGKVLLLGAHARVADKPFSWFLFETHL